MAQLTWKNVDAPSFSGVTDAARLANEALNRGIQTSRQALEAYEKDQTQAEGARLLAATSGVSDPTKLQAIISGFNPAYLSQEAIKTALERPKNIADVNQTNTMSGYYQSNTDRTRALLPHQVTAAALGNNATEMSNAGAAVDLKNKMQNDAYTQQGRELLNKAQAASNGTVEGTVEALRNMRGVDARVQAAAIEEATKLGATLTPNVDVEAFKLGNAVDAERRRLGLPTPNTLPNPGINVENFVRYNNQSAVRNLPLAPELIKSMSFLPDMGITMQVNSGGQKSNKPGEGLGSDRHTDGNSGDVQFMQNGRALSWKNPQDVPTLQKIVQQARANGVTGIGAGPGYMNPTTTHIGFGKEAVWGAKGGKPYQALLDAAAGVTPGAAPNLAARPQGAPALGPGPSMAQQPATVQPGVDDPGRVNERLDQAKAFAQRSQFALDKAIMDSALDPLSGLTEEFMTRPNKDVKTAGDATERVAKELSAGKGGMFDEDGSKEVIRGEITRIQKAHNLPPDLAAMFVKDGIVQNANWFRADTKSIDSSWIDTKIREFFSEDGGVNGLQSRLSASRAKTESQAELKKLNESVEKANQKLANTMSRAKTPEARANAMMEHRVYMANLQQRMEAVAKNPLLDANTRKIRESRAPVPSPAAAPAPAVAGKSAVQQMLDRSVAAPPANLVFPQAERITPQGNLRPPVGQGANTSPIDLMRIRDF